MKIDRRFQMKKIACLFFAFFFLAVGHAFADLYTFAFVDGSFTASGTLQTASTNDGSGYLTVTSGSLNAPGITAAPLYTAAGTLPVGSSTTSPLGAFLYDNRLAPTSTTSLLSSGGLLFTAPTGSGGSQEINIWGSGGANNYSYWVGTAAGNYSTQLNGGTFTLSQQASPVPLPPAAWLLTSGFFALVGFRKRLHR
jgi:hypothetical protein